MKVIADVLRVLAQVSTDRIEQAIQTVWEAFTQDDQYARENLSSKYLFGSGECGVFALALADALGEGELVCLVGVENEGDLDDPEYVEQLGTFGISPVIGKPRELLHVALRVRGQLYDGGGRVPDPEFGTWRADHEVTELEVLDPKDPGTRDAIIEATGPEEFTVDELSALLREALHA